MSVKHQNYTPEFKSQAIALVTEAKRPTAEVARELGIKANTLYGWFSQAKISADSEPASAALTAENKRLKKELAQAKLERDILKKAAAYFTHAYLMIF